MLIHATKPLFPWDELAVSPTLATIKDTLCAHAVSVLIVHLAFATLLAKAQRAEGSFGTMTISPIAKKLRALMGETAADSA